MRIGIITPAPPGSLSGNRVTALRWARLLRQLGNRVEIGENYAGENYHLLLALHLRHGAAAALHFRRLFPERPLIMALTGTDIYAARLDSAASRLLRSASALVALQPLALERLPAWAREKARVIYQSAPAAERLPRRRRSFDLCLLSHLRRVKDPLLPAHAAQALPAGSRIRILHAGAQREPGMEAAALRAMRASPRYRWLGPLPRAQARRLLRRSRALLLSSQAEGGANVVGEALRAGIPVLASRIPGNIGLLGKDYAGYFAPGNEMQLRRLMLKVERDAEFLAQLERRCRALAGRFTPERERAAWRRLLGEVAGD